MNALTAIARRRHDHGDQQDQQGFTLIELMVVVLIIAILIAIAIPTFLGARSRAQDRAAESSLRNGLTSAKTIFTDQEDYTQATGVALKAVEPSLTFNGTNVAATAASTGQNDVSVSSTTATKIAMAAWSKSGTCFFIADDSQAGGTTFGSTPNATSTSCTATATPSSGWKSSW